MKNIVKIFSTVILVFMLSITAFAHPGRTDANGGHYDRKTGTYHYHNGGSSSSSSSSSSYNFNYDPPFTPPYKSYSSSTYSKSNNNSSSTPNTSSQPSLSSNTDTKLSYPKIEKYEWKTKDKNKYCINKDTNKKVSGFCIIGDKTYLFDKNGIMQKGWVKVNNDTFYFNKNGHMLTGKYKINGIIYSFDKTGKLISGTPSKVKIVSLTKETSQEQNQTTSDLKFIGGLYKHGEDFFSRIETDTFEPGFIYVRGKLVGNTNDTKILRVDIEHPDGSSSVESLILTVNGEIDEVVFIPWGHNQNGKVTVSLEATGEQLAVFDYYVY